MTARIRLTLAATAVGLALGASANAAPPPIGVHATGQDRETVVRYWTPSRMASAVPRTPTRTVTLKGSGGGSGAGYTITKLTDAQRTGVPGRTNGKVYMTFGSTNYQCSGTALTSTNESTVLTAGHCVHDRAKGFARNFVFVPAKGGSSEPYGRWAATAVYTTTPWGEAGDFSFDLGAAKVAPDSTGATLTDVVGGRDITFGGPRSQAYTLYGYPAAKKYSGQDLYACATRYAMDDPGVATNPEPIGVRCNWPGGSSGGAWIGADGNVASVTSFGYSSFPDYVFGPYLPAGQSGTPSVAEDFITAVRTS